jgi:uncharacterized protein
MNGSDDVVRTIRFDPTEQGDPTTRTTSKPWYKDPTGLFVAGFWSAQWGKVDVTYTKDEFCVLLEGEVRITDASGHVETYRQGDALVIPNGFKGTWETVKPVRKFFATYQPAKV